MKRFMVIGRKKSIWFLLGAALYILVILLAKELGIQDGDTVDIYDFEFEYQR